MEDMLPLLLVSLAVSTSSPLRAAEPPTPGTAADLWQVLPFSESAAENCARLQAALSAAGTPAKPAHHSIALPPGRSTRIQCTIRLKAGRALYVPPDSELVYSPPTDATGPLVAIEVDGPGALLGLGSLRVEGDEVLRKSKPRTGILLTGSEGTVQFGLISGFEYGLHFLGDGRGSAYNDVRLRSIKNALHAVRLDARSGGWVNQNYVHVSRIWTNLQAHPFWEATYGIHIDSQDAHHPNANRFSGSIEGVHTGVHLSGANNRLDGLRLELKGTDPATKKSYDGTKVEIDHTSWFNSECKGIKPGCAATSDNWWFGEYGVIHPEKDLRFTREFLKHTPKLGERALQTFGVAGMDRQKPVTPDSTRTEAGD